MHEFVRSPVLICVVCAVCFVAPGVLAASSDWAEAPKPSYPLNAALEGRRGEVVLRVVVNRDGHVSEVTITKSSGKKELDYAARGGV